MNVRVTFDRDKDVCKIMQAAGAAKIFPEYTGGGSFTDLPSCEVIDPSKFGVAIQVPDRTVFEKAAGLIAQTLWRLSCPSRCACRDRSFSPVRHNYHTETHIGPNHFSFPSES
jgi:hypothetical protein